MDGAGQQPVTYATLAEEIEKSLGAATEIERRVEGILSHLIGLSEPKSDPHPAPKREVQGMLPGIHYTLGRILGKQRKTTQDLERIHTLLSMDQIEGRVLPESQAPRRTIHPGPE